MARPKRKEHTRDVRLVLKDSMINLIEIMVDVGGYDSRNEVIRDAIRTHFNILCADKRMYDKIREYTEGGKKLPPYCTQGENNGI